MLTQIRFRCYYCHRTHTVEASAAGKKGRCLCGKMMVVPQPPEDAGEAPPPEGDGELPVAAPPPAESPVPAESSPAGSDTGGFSGKLSQLELGASPVPAAGGDTKPARAFPGVVEILASLPLVALALAHQFRDELAARNILELPDPDYLSLPASFWSAVLFTLSGALLLDGVLRLARWAKQR